MRNPVRLNNLYEVLLKAHRDEFPDWRFGQLMSNFFGWCIETGRCSDIFFPEDHDWIKWIIEFSHNVK